MTPRQQAQAQGLARYHGKPCHRCGGTERNTCNRNCLVCEALRQRVKYQTNDEYRKQKLDYDASVSGVRYARRLLQNRRRKALQRMAERAEMTSTSLE